MTANFYHFSKKPNSTALPAGDPAYTCDLHIKDGYSIVNPVFIIRYPDQAEGVDITETVPRWNYLHLPLYGRYYYINDVVAVTAGVWELHCNVDVLASFKASILSSQQYVVRSSSDYDTTIPDNAYQMTGKPTVRVRNYSPSLFSATDWTECSYVLIIQNGVDETSTEPFTAYVLDSSNVLAFLRQMGEIANFNNISSAIDDTLAKMLFDPSNYIVSFRAYPFRVPRQAGTIPLRFGLWDAVEGLEAHPILNQMAYCVWHTETPPDDPDGDNWGFVEIEQHPQVARGVWTNFPPYTSLSMHFSIFGDVELDPLWGEVRSDRFNRLCFRARVYVDFITGMARLIFYRDANYTQVVAVRETKLGVDVPISVTTMVTPTLGQLITSGTMSAGFGITQMINKAFGG